MASVRPSGETATAIDVPSVTVTSTAGGAAATRTRRLAMATRDTIMVAQRYGFPILVGTRRVDEKFPVRSRNPFCRRIGIDGVWRAGSITPRARRDGWRRYPVSPVTL